MEKVKTMTSERIIIGPGTLYNLLDSFEKAGMIYETKVEGRRRSYLITDEGMDALEIEYQRLIILAADYRQYRIDKGGIFDENNKA
jgi:DNA-binding PadR family transcriptional regulator